MHRPILFLLKHDFQDPKLDSNVKYYCPHCATIEGVLGYFPDVRRELDIRYVDFPRPRHEIIELLGEANQSCPVLILPTDEKRPHTPGKLAKGREFFSSASEIGLCFSELFLISRPH